MVVRRIGPGRYILVRVFCELVLAPWGGSLGNGCSAPSVVKYTTLGKTILERARRQAQSDESPSLRRSHHDSVFFFSRDSRFPAPAVHLHCRFRPLAREDSTARGSLFADLVHGLATVRVHAEQTRRLFVHVIMVAAFRRREIFVTLFGFPRPFWLEVNKPRIVSRVVEQLAYRSIPRVGCGSFSAV